MGFNLVKLVRVAPNLLSILRVESIAGLYLFDWSIKKYGGIIDQMSYDLLMTLSKLEVGIVVIFFTSYVVLSCGAIPYLFYKYLK